MVAEASARLSRFGLSASHHSLSIWYMYIVIHIPNAGGQARVVCTKDQQGFLGDPGLEGRMDAFISTYVFDLLSDAEIANALTLAWR